MIKEKNGPVRKERREEHSSETYSLPVLPSIVHLWSRTQKRKTRGGDISEKEEKMKDVSEENEGPKSKTEGQRKEFSL